MERQRWTDCHVVDIALRLDSQLMRIRTHSAADYQQIVRLRWMLKAGDDVACRGRGFEKFARAYLEHLIASDRAGATVHWIAEKDRHVVGLMTLRSIAKEPSLSGRGSSWGYLTNSIVLAEHRNQGVGTNLLAAVTDWARSSGLEFLVVWPSERSYSLYRRCGFSGQVDPLVLELD